ncbi:MAG: DMT family transporter [Patescibacteria group bacterium]|mgnify:CR=1 FL=1
MKLSRVQIAILFLIIANIIWGATAPIFKWALQDIEPFLFGFLRFLLSALILLPFTIHHLKIKKKDIPLLLFIAIIGLGLRIAYDLFGLILSPSVNAPIISSAAPIFILIGGIFLFRERATKKVFFGGVLSLIGVLVIVLQPVFEQDIRQSLLGNIFLIISAGLMVMYTLFLKQLTPSYRTVTLLFWIFLIAAFTFFPFAYIETLRSDTGFTINTQGLLGIIFAVLFTTCIAYWMETYAIKHINVSDVGLFTYMDPFIAIAIAQPLLGETINSTFILGGALIFLGLFIAENRIHYHPIHLLHPKYKKHLALAENEETTDKLPPQKP